MGFTEMKRKNAYIVLAEIVSAFLRAFLLKIECLPSVVLWLNACLRVCRWKISGWKINHLPGVGSDRFSLQKVVTRFTAALVGRVFWKKVRAAMYGERRVVARRLWAAAR